MFECPARLYKYLILHGFAWKTANTEAIFYLFAVAGH
jgi:hypothetical protein